MALTLGLAIVFMTNGSLQFSDEVPVNFPKTRFGEILVVFPREKNQIPYWARGGASGCGK